MTKRIKIFIYDVYVGSIYVDSSMSNSDIELLVEAYIEEKQNAEPEKVEYRWEE